MDDTLDEDDSPLEGRSRRSNRNMNSPLNVLAPVSSSRRSDSDPLRLRLKNGPPSKRRKQYDDRHRETFAKLEQVEKLSQGMSNRTTTDKTSATPGNSSGIIKSLSLYNFMCHESFHQEWHENINFIVGENGSGKSALLSGLLVGLGAKALTTARTSSIKDLIKTGKNFAKIEVKLLNRGLISEETYGRELTIHRILDIKGTTTYKIQKNGDKCRLLRKPELDKILLDLNIQLENPVVILNQEYARSFLCSKNPKDKYKLFQDGTGAYQCKSILDEITDDIEKITENLETKKEEVDRAFVKFNKVKEKVKIIDGAAAYKDKMKNLTLELAWRHVTDEEKANEKCNEELEKGVQDYLKTKDRYNESLKKKKKLAEESAPSLEVQGERKKEKERLEGQRNTLRESIAVARREMSSAKMKVSSNTALISSKEKMASNLQVRAARDDEKAKEDHERLKQQVLEQKEAFTLEVTSLEQEIETVKRDCDHFWNGAETIKTELDSTRSKRREIEAVLTRKKTQLRQLQSSADTISYDAFGPRMAKLVAKIKSMKNKFYQEPKGPLGACFKVKKQEYANIIQYYLRSKLCDFIVDNSRDAQMLNGIITSIYGTKRVPDSPRPNVLLMKFCNAHDYSATNSSRGLKFPSIIDMLDVENNDHIVTNALLDFCQVERFLLFKDTNEALTILQDQSTTPKMCKGGFTLDFYKITPDPNLRVDAIKERRNESQLIRTSTAMQIKALTVEIRSLEEELYMYVIDEDKVSKESELRNEFETRNKCFREKRVQLNSVKNKLKSLKEPTNRLADQSSVKDEIQELREDVVKLQNEVIEQKAVLEMKESVLKEKEEEKVKIDADIELVHQEISGFYDYQEKQKEQSRKLDIFIERLEASMEKSEAKKVSLEEECVMSETKLAESTRKASDRGERVETRRTIKEIIKESDLIRAKLGEIEKTVGNRDDIYKAFEAVKKNYECIHKHFQIVHTIHEHLQNYADRVRTYYLWSRDRLVEALKRCFECIVKSRGYKGSIIIDHDQEELYYFICPDEESSEKMNMFERNLNSAKYRKTMMEYVAGLSGGERSFSTICFIISMWQAMKSPFYMLDEFDVFMDALNRKTSQLALMSHAKTFPANQFFFFTPLDLTSVPHKDEALVLRMYPPERDNSANGDENVIPPEPVASTSSAARRRKGSDIATHAAKTPRI